MPIVVLLFLGIGTMVFIGVSNFLRATGRFFKPTTHAINEWLVDSLMRGGMTERAARGTAPVIEALFILLLVGIFLL